MARAVYSNADVYVFDDPLSAVDSHVANHIFNKCFLELLKGKTIILATHAVSFLKYADNILLVHGADGERDQMGSTITLQGTLQEFINAKVNLTQFILHHDDEEDELEQSIDVQATPVPLLRRGSTITEVAYKSGLLHQRSIPRKISALSDPGSQLEQSVGELIRDEERGLGDIGWDIYGLYVFAAGGLCLFLLCIGFMASYYGSNTVSQFWLAFWSDSEIFGHSVNQNQWWWLEIYVSIQFGSLLMLFLAAAMALITRLRASRYLHEALLNKMLHAPMEFFGVLLFIFGDSLLDYNNELR